MQKLGQAAQEAVKQIESKTASTEISQKSSTSLPALKDDQASRTRLTEVIEMAYNGLKVYGKEPEQLSDARKLFGFVLADYNIQQVREAFAYYFKHYSEFPAPADIANIIERGNKPPFDKAVYVNISKKHPEDRDADEWAYMRDYEAYMLNG